MRRSRAAAMALSILTMACGLGLGSTIPSLAFADETALNGHKFTIPPGFAIERAAGQPLTDRPITADFDEQGRLYVADSSGSGDKVQKQLEDRPHRIVRLEDADGDGRFDKSVVFADKMMFPEGTMWFDGSLYVSAPPSIWKLTDTDGDGKADQRVEWFQGKTLTGCANDLHGPYLGPDGWIYWCKGAFAEQTYTLPGRSKPFVTKASHIFRCRPDGSGIEPVMTGGMDNPVDVVFTPGGERIFTTTFLQQPEGGKRDGLIHAIYGGVYGKVHAVIDGHPRTSADVMPVLSHLGPAAPAGLARYESSAFGPDYRDNVFSCLFNLRKVMRHSVAPQGAMLASRDEDFVVSDNHDFHPTDIVEDADGSLLIIDTGGWYKLCCPSSQLGKPDVLGAIYRVKRKDAPRVADPRGLALSWTNAKAEDIAPRLEDARPAVRKRAMQALAKLGASATSALRAQARSGSPSVRRDAVWTLTRIDDPQARAAVRLALGDSDDQTRQAALHSVSLRRDAEAAPKLLEIALRSGSAQNRRAAAEAIGRLRHPALAGELIKAFEGGMIFDRALDHSLIYALIETGAAEPLRSALAKAKRPAVIRAALIALDQMDAPNGGLKPIDAIAHLESSDQALREAASWIAGRHPEWGGALVDRFDERLIAKPTSEGERIELEQQLARFASSAPVQELLARRLNHEESTARAQALRVMANSGLREAPASWLAGLAKAIGDPDADLCRQALLTLRSLPMPKTGASAMTAALRGLGADEASRTPDLRLEAMALTPGGLGAATPEQFAFLTSQLREDRPVSARTMAADVLAKAKLTLEQKSALIPTLQDAGPIEADRLLAAFEGSTETELGLKLIAALKKSRALANLRADAVQTRLAKFDPETRQAAASLYEMMNADLAKQKAKLESLLAQLAQGDIRRGQAVFNSAKAACASCHAIGYVGGKVGPDLTRIGQVRNERDLLESIVFPNLSFVRSYEPVAIETKSGRVLNGLVRQETAADLVLATGPNEETRVARDEIEAIQPSKVSVMPAGLDQQLSPQELADLVAFLKNCK